MGLGPSSTRIIAAAVGTDPEQAPANSTLGTVVTYDVPLSGDDAASDQVVRGDDSRLSDSRNPTSHTHDDRYFTESEVASALATKADLVGGVIPTAQIPAIAITAFLGTVANQSAMLALSGQYGDWCIRSDTGATWVITGSDPTVLGNWTALGYPASPVTSVNGQTGAVTLGYSDVGAAASGHDHSGVYQPLDATLTALASLSTSADQLIYATGANAFAMSALTAAARGLLDDADNTAMRTTLGLGTAATLNAPASGNASSTEVVLGSDTRLGGGGATVVSSAVSSNTNITGTSAAWVDSTLSVALTEGTWDFDGSKFNWFWGATGKNTQNRLKVTAGSITKTDGRVVGECRIVGGTSTQMTYTAATGVISGGSQSSGTNSVVFLMDGFVVVPSGGCTITLQYLTGPGSGETVVFEQGSCLKATKR